MTFNDFGDIIVLESVKESDENIAGDKLFNCDAGETDTEAVCSISSAEKKVGDD